MSAELEDQIPLAFGKHKGRTPTEVAGDDPGYIVWLYDNVPGTVSRDLAVACDQDIEAIYEDGDYDYGDR